MTKNLPNARGFTLLEVLVALAVLALALAAGIKAAGSNIDNAAYLRDRTLAHWVAMNKLTEMQVFNKFPTTGTTERGSLLVAGSEWYWTVQTTVNKAIPTYEFGVATIEVRHSEDAKQALATLVTAY
ncbi:MAG: type II secretion system minor pseudopilin GspI [Gammaproteobacteria bacterium]|nr:type II secretion system minor pseudopilin GspI [Gammaproteobacteria bacterium]